ncbi:spore coat protein YsxE [Fervidibacillus halotolerans]|uniref:Spore coat protein YsxE n=1 Tax=Fervidibacillus halotolerans TaxID=2980027 RepID=A0A9E8LXK9_9BACI|nr:spore coat protein YsxE [Fervidibacillus halotolerans]WAA11593.1 spore coat protein YsxE [Fervidibacillus halotolerans]
MNYEEIVEILNHYQIRPYEIEKKGKVYKISSREGMFALKKTTVQQFQRFLFHLQYLNNQGFYQFIPILPTISGTYAVNYGDELFYLMPWFSEKKDENIMEKLFRELGRLHTLSVKEWKIDQEMVENHYHRTKEKWEGEVGFLEAFIDLCENKWYMSPFEWKFVEYFYEFRKAYDYAFHQLHLWKDEIEREGIIRSVLIHGNSGKDHFLFSDQGKGYFISWEKSRFSSPFFDVLPLLKQTLHTYPFHCDQCLHWLDAYFKYFPLKTEEERLMKGYLAQPGFIISTIQSYQTTQERNKEYIFTRRLTKHYWLLKNTEYVVMKLEERNNNLE